MCRAGCPETCRGRFPLPPPRPSARAPASASCLGSALAGRGLPPSSVGARRVHEPAAPHPPAARAPDTMQKEEDVSAIGGAGGAGRATRVGRGWGQQRGASAPPTRQQLDLNQDLHGCDSIEQILVVIERAKTRKVALSTVNVITAVNKLAKLRSPGKRQRVEELLLVRPRRFRSLRSWLGGAVRDSETVPRKLGTGTLTRKECAGRAAAYACCAARCQVL